MSKQDFDKARKSNPSPLSIYFNWAQIDKLDELRQGQKRGTFIKEVIFNSGKRLVRRYAETDRILIAKVLAALGKSRISSNINQLAKAANSGSLPVNEEVEKALLKACMTIEWIKVTLIESMGIKPQRPEPPEQDNDLTR
jgi:hypothetical protein